ncbi:MAG: hypothetical protein ABJZ55_25670 [Fuerstiella sp.]
MYFVSQKICTSAFLVVYISCSLFGQSIHLCQCASTTESSSVADECSSCRCAWHAGQQNTAKQNTAEQNTARQKSNAKQNSALISDELNSNEHASHEHDPNKHDPDQCAVCQTLALAQDHAVALVGIVGSEALPERQATVYVAIDPIRINAIQSRGPPA